MAFDSDSKSAKLDAEKGSIEILEGAPKVIAELVVDDRVLKDNVGLEEYLEVKNRGLLIVGIVLQVYGASYFGSNFTNTVIQDSRAEQTHSPQNRLLRSFAHVHNVYLAILGQDSSQLCEFVRNSCRPSSLQ